MTTNIVLTGAMGSGKSTVLELLKQGGYITVEEPARTILEEQRAIGGEGLPEINSKLFTQLLLSRAIYQYKLNQEVSGLVIYDRGIPDIIAYAQLFKFNFKAAHQAAKIFRYHQNVFIFPAWQDIYTMDEERTMSFESAKEFGLAVRSTYEKRGYFPIEVPCVSADERANFIIEKMKGLSEDFYASTR